MDKAMFDFVLSSSPQKLSYAFVQAGFFSGFVLFDFLFFICMGAARFHTLKMDCRWEGLL
jgi:hypothetical protein